MNTPAWNQQYLCTPTSPAPLPEVGHIAHNIHTGHTSPIVHTDKRADSRLFCTLESGQKCVIPSPNWTFHQTMDALQLALETMDTAARLAAAQKSTPA